MPHPKNSNSKYRIWFDKSEACASPLITRLIKTLDITSKIRHVPHPKNTNWMSPYQWQAKLNVDANGLLFWVFSCFSFHCFFFSLWSYRNMELMFRFVSSFFSSKTEDFFQAMKVTLLHMVKVNSHANCSWMTLQLIPPYWDFMLRIKLCRHDNYNILDHKPFNIRIYMTQLQQKSMWYWELEKYLK